MCPDSEPHPSETPRTRAFRADDSLSLEALQRIDRDLPGLRGRLAGGHAAASSSNS